VYVKLDKQLFIALVKESKELNFYSYHNKELQNICQMI